MPRQQSYIVQTRLIGNTRTTLQAFRSEAQHVHQTRRQAVLQRVLIADEETVLLPSPVEKRDHAVIEDVEEVRHGVVLLPHAPLWKILIFSQVGNGIWLPVVIIFILLLVNRRDLMGDYVNTVTFNIIAWVTAIFMIGLTLFLSYASLFQGAPASQ